MEHNHNHNNGENSQPSSCCAKKNKIDWLLWISFTIVLLGCSFYLIFGESLSSIHFLYPFVQGVYELVLKMWWGLLLGIFFVGVLAKMPREIIISILGRGNTMSGILRATGAGVLLDLCSHGILVVGMQLYKRGATLGQTMALLIASPWNSFSLTLILIALIGFKWTFLFVLFSMIIAVISGLIFDKLVDLNILPKNPNTSHLPENYKTWSELKKQFRNINYSFKNINEFVRLSFSESKMVLRWIFFGIVLTGVVRMVLSPESFQILFGPTLAGIGMTVFVATILEICSEGSSPIAADILTRAHAPGNAFAFLMTGVSTDYTEIASLKETTGSWKIGLFLPLVTLPQILLIAWLMNM